MRHCDRYSLRGERHRDKTSWTLLKFADVRIIRATIDVILKSGTFFVDAKLVLFRTKAILHQTKPSKTPEKRQKRCFWQGYDRMKLWITRMKYSGQGRSAEIGSKSLRTQIRNFATYRILNNNTDMNFHFGPLLAAISLTALGLIMRKQNKKNWPLFVVVGLAMLVLQIISFILISQKS